MTDGHATNASAVRLFTDILVLGAAIIPLPIRAKNRTRFQRRLPRSDAVLAHLRFDDGILWW
jgi:hypothetical protein